jgi:hypothetical protein
LAQTLLKLYHVLAVLDNDFLGLFGMNFYFAENWAPY